MEFTAGFTLLPGQYSLKLLARDAETGRIGTYLAQFTIPNLAQQSGRLAMSTVVLSNQRVALKAALFNAKKAMEKAEEEANPLVRNGEELLPSVTRVFSREQTMEVYAQVYERGRTRMEPLTAYVAFYRDGEKKMETEPGADRCGVKPPAYAVPIGMRVPLKGLKPGRYTCQVSVLDAVGGQAAFWRAMVWIVR